MKLIRFKTSKKGYLDMYVGVALSPFKLTKTEKLVVAQILYYINIELDDAVPIDAAIKLVSMLDYKHMIKDSLKLSEASIGNIFMSLRKKDILDENNRMLKKLVIKYSDEGFAYNILIKEDETV